MYNCRMFDTVNDSKYDTKEEVFERGAESVGKNFMEIDKTGRLSAGKGAIGQLVEESWFHYKPNSRSEPDFPKAGVELKVTPYVHNVKGDIRAKERLVCNIINYIDEYQNGFYESSFWHKCKCMLILSYEHRRDVSKADYTVDAALLFIFPNKDLPIIKHDYDLIMEKIRDGHAEDIKESDTMYLSACTKGKDSGTLRDRPCFS